MTVQKSFRDTRNETVGRVNYGPGKEPARDFQLKLAGGAGGAGLSVWPKFSSSVSPKTARRIFVALHSGNHGEH